MNSVNLMGRLTKDPEIRYTNTQIPYARFSLAVDRNYIDKATGKRGVDFFDCVAWRQTAETIGRYVTKGSLIGVTGELQTYEYTDRDNNKRRGFQIVVNDFTFGTNKSQSQAEPAGGYGNNSNYGGERQNSGASVPPDPSPSPFDEIIDDEGDLPF